MPATDPTETNHNQKNKTETAPGAREHSTAFGRLYQNPERDPKNKKEKDGEEARLGASIIRAPYPMANIEPTEKTRSRKGHRSPSWPHSVRPL